MPTFPVIRPHHGRSIQCTAVQELYYVAGSRAGPTRGEHHYVADSDSLCFGAGATGRPAVLASAMPA